MFGFSAGEILLIAILALVLFGNEKLPQNIKKFLRGWNDSKKVVGDFRKSWQDIKMDLIQDVELLEEKKGVEKSALSIEPKVDIHSVSQEEIDNYQAHLENPPPKLSQPSLHHGGVV